MNEPAHSLAGIDGLLHQVQKYKVGDTVEFKDGCSKLKGRICWIQQTSDEIKISVYVKGVKDQFYMNMNKVIRKI